MKIRNKGGDVALCVLWNSLDSVTSFLPDSKEFPRLSVIGNLRTPLGISWFLRGLGRLSHITTVVVWGSDLGRTGEALFSLWEEGITDEHLVPGFGWKLDPLIDRESINRLRREVTLVDARGFSLDGLGQFLPSLSQQHRLREPVTFPPVELPERTIFPSQGGFVQLFVQNPADGWIQIQNLLVRCGRERRTRKGETLNHLFDIKVVMPVARVEEIGPPFGFSQDDFEAYYREFISFEPPPEGIDYRYGHRFQSWRNHNQLEEVIARLKKSPDTKRATIVLLDPTDLDELEDAPCLALGTFCIQSRILNSSWVIRSNDMFSGWPFNILALLRVHRIVGASLLGVNSTGYASFLSQNAQIYEHHFPAVEENLRQWGRKPEEFGIGYRFEPDPAGNFIFAIEDGQVRMTMTSPQGDQVLMEMTHCDPSALIGWVVETMPHLVRQHIRYLGREEESLWGCLREGTSYVQG